MGKGKRLRSLRKAGKRTISKDVQDKRQRLTESRDASIVVLRGADQLSEAQLAKELVWGLDTSIQIIEFDSRYHQFPPEATQRITQAKVILQHKTWKNQAAMLQELVNFHFGNMFRWELEYDLWMDDIDYINFVLLSVYRLVERTIRSD